MQADVSRDEDVARVLAEVAEAGPPLRGVVHAAGVLDDGILMRQDWSRFQSVMSPKVAGALHLDRMTRDCELDLFVMFSSAASLMGSPGRGIMQRPTRCSMRWRIVAAPPDCPALSINWGPWGESGMAADTAAQAKRQWESMGIGSVARPRAFDLEMLLEEEDVAQVGVMPIDWTKLMQRFPPGMEPPLLAHVAKTCGARSSPRPSGWRSSRSSKRRPPPNAASC